MGLVSMLTAADWERRLGEFVAEIGYQEKVVQLLEETLDKPIFCPEHLGFRYINPGPKHFCLLKAARCVSALWAIVPLLEAGFSQEIAVLIRTIVENTTHIELVLVDYKDGQLGDSQLRHISDYFADSERSQAEKFKKPRMRQADVHKTVGSRLDSEIGKSERALDFQEVDSAKLMSRTYLCYSNYVHSRYPEAMDLYGGRPPHFHLRGMSKTPKDAENLEIVEAFAIAVSNALRQMVLKLVLRERVEGYPALARWLVFELGLSAKLNK
jgi:hypothetical protein